MKEKVFADNVFLLGRDIGENQSGSCSIIDGIKKFLNKRIHLRRITAGVLKGETQLPNGRLSSFFKRIVLFGIVTTNCSHCLVFLFPIAEEFTDGFDHGIFTRDKQRSGKTAELAHKGNPDAIAYLDIAGFADG